MVRKILFCGAVAVVFGLGGVPAGAQPVGRVLMSVGEVVANRGGSTVVLGTGINIESGDQIRTGPSSGVQVRLNDSSIIALKSQTIFSIDEFVYSGRSDGRERAFFNLIAGGMRTVTGLIGKANQRNYAIKTPTATVGIRGSGFNLTACTPAAPCTNNDGSRARDGTYGQVFDLAIFSQTNAGTQDWQKGDVFLIPDPNSLGERLREAPGFLAHTLVERSRNAGRLGGTDGTTGGTAQTVATDGRATQTPSAPAPLVFAATETRNATGGVAVIAATTVVTGFIVNYTLAGGLFEGLGDCGRPPCGSGEITNAQFSGSQLIGYSTTTSPATLSAAGATVTNLQTLDVGGSMIGIYQLTGPLSGVASGGTPYSNPGAFLVGFTNDPGAGNGFALPTSGNFTFGGPGNSIGLMVDAAGNSAPISLTGSFNAVSRAASFSANGTFSNVAGFGSASLIFSSSGTVSGTSNEVKAAGVNFTCTGPGCQTPSGSGSADIFFLRSASGIKALVANGGLVGATGPGNRVVFIGAGRCTSGPC